MSISPTTHPTRSKLFSDRPVFQATAQSMPVQGSLGTAAVLRRFMVMAFITAVALVAILTLFTVLAPTAAAQDPFEGDLKAKRPSHVLAIRPVPGSPTRSGNQLRATLRRLDASPTQRWLIRLEPGVYDLGGQPLELKSWIDIEGSGFLQTEIVGLGSDSNGYGYLGAGVVIGADHVQLRDLTVRCVNTAARDACVALVNLGAAPRLTRVHLVAEDPAGRLHWGLRNIDASPVIEDSEIRVAEGEQNYGIANVGEAFPQIEQTMIHARDGRDITVALANKDGALPSSIEHTKLHASSTNGLVAGIRQLGYSSAPGTELTLLDVEIRADGGSTSYGVLDGAFRLVVRGGRILVSGGTAIHLSDGEVEAMDAELRGAKRIVDAGEVRLVSTWLRGGGRVEGIVELCSGVHTDDFVTLDACP